MTKKGTENMSAQVSMNDLDVRIVKPSNIKSEVNYAFNRKSGLKVKIQNINIGKCYFLNI